ncbi:hypothetical protein N0V85_005302 [Neurospora sp. IMI 360204]|nr:hypothetical protein N0V85_005302 [Neurospora sp. IMI 360204]
MPSSVAALGITIWSAETAPNSRKSGPTWLRISEDDRASILGREGHASSKENVAKVAANQMMLNAHKGRKAVDDMSNINKLQKFIENPDRLNKRMENLAIFQQLGRTFLELSRRKKLTTAQRDWLTRQGALQLSDLQFKMSIQTLESSLQILFTQPMTLNRTNSDTIHREHCELTWCPVIPRCGGKALEEQIAVLRRFDKKFESVDEDIRAAVQTANVVQDQIGRYVGPVEKHGNRLDFLEAKQQGSGNFMLTCLQRMGEFTNELEARDSRTQATLTQQEFDKLMNDCVLNRNKPETARIVILAATTTCHRRWVNRFPFSGEGAPVDSDEYVLRNEEMDLGNSRKAGNATKKTFARRAHKKGAKKTVQTSR